MGKLGFFYHEDCLNHMVPAGHPENKTRLNKILSKLNSKTLTDFKLMEPKLADDDLIKLGHSETYLETLYDLVPTSGIIKLDPDTFMSPGTLRSAKRGVGAVIAAIDGVLNNTIRNAFCAIRPPGHHAEKEKAMGFCFLNAVGIGAKYALRKKEIERVAVIDFDVHHGNGTQRLLWNEPNCLFISIHQKMLFPQTGFEEETGVNDNILNIPVSPFSSGSNLRTLFDETIVPKLSLFDPDILLLSAGFDGHISDQISQTCWLTEDYTYITKKLKRFAEKNCKNRIVSSLEGGYELNSLGECCEAHIKALME